MREFLPADLRDDVKFIAAQRKTTMAQVLRDAVALYMNGDLIPGMTTRRPTIPVDLRIRLKVARAERHVSLRQLGEIIDVRADELSRFETGKLNLTDAQCAAVEGWLQPIVTIDPT